MTVLAYEYNAAVANHHDVLEKIKLFAVARGWIAQEWEKNSVIWGETGTPGVYGWLVGTESFLRLYSTGYGSQQLQYRFRLPHSGTNNSRILAMGAFLEDQGNDTTSEVHPVGRNALGNANWNPYGDFSLSSDPVDLWLFGSEKMIMAVIKYDQAYIQTLFFGSLELIDNTETEAAWASYNYNYATTVDHWYNKTALCPFDVDILCCYRDFLRNYTDLFSSFIMTGGNSFAAGPGCLARLAIENKYSEVRPLGKQIIYLKDTDDFLFALGTHWASRIWHKGLAIGEHVFYGESEYVIFPWGKLSLTEHNYGFAIQVA